MASAATASVSLQGAASAPFTAQASPRINGSKGASFLSLPVRRSSLNSSRLRVTCEASASSSVGKPETLKKVVEIVSKQLAAAEGTVHPHSKFQDLGADSLDQVEIVMALEEEFNINVDEDGAGAIVTVQDAADLIEKVISKA